MGLTMFDNWTRSNIICLITSDHIYIHIVDVLLIWSNLSITKKTQLRFIHQLCRAIATLHQPGNGAGPSISGDSFQFSSCELGTTNLKSREDQVASHRPIWIEWLESGLATASWLSEHDTAGTVSWWKLSFCQSCLIVFWKRIDYFYPKQSPTGLYRTFAHNVAGEHRQMHRRCNTLSTIWITCACLESLAPRRWWCYITV